MHLSLHRFVLSAVLALNIVGHVRGLAFLNSTSNATDTHTLSFSNLINPTSPPFLNTSATSISLDGTSSNQSTFSGVDPGLSTSLRVSLTSSQPPVSSISSAASLITLTNISSSPSTTTSALLGGSEPSLTLQTGTATTSPNSSTITSTASSFDPLDEQPVISTLVSVESGSTQSIPVLIGGAFTTPVPITASAESLDATGVIASSSASALSSHINIDIIPLLKEWTDNPAKDQSDKAVAAIKGILPNTENLLKSLGGDQSSSPCSGSKRDLVAKGLIPNPFKIAKDIIHSVSCIVNTLSKITAGISGGADAVKGILGDINDLTSLTKGLDEEEKGEDDQTNSETQSDSSTSESTSTSTTASSSSSSSSSASCTQSSATLDYYINCFPHTISGVTGQPTQTCITSTSTARGCDITAFSTTSTTSSPPVYATSIVTAIFETGLGAPAPTPDEAWLSSRIREINAGFVFVSNETSTVLNNTSSLSTLSHTTFVTSTLESSSQTSLSTSSSSSANWFSLIFPYTRTTKTMKTSTSSIISSSTALASSTTTSNPPAPPAPPPASTKVVPPPAHTGICSMHIYEGVHDSRDKTLDMTAEIKDGSGKSLASIKQSPKWGDQLTISSTQSDLSYDVSITFSTKSASKRSLPDHKPSLWRRICCDIPPPPKDFSYETRLVNVQAGPWNYDSTWTDSTKTLHMNVGKWDRNGSPPNRQLDAYWYC